MKVNDVFQFPINDGTNIQAVALDAIIVSTDDGEQIVWICYGQNKLFKIIEVPLNNSVEYVMGDVIVEYAVLPSYDDAIDAYIDNELSNESY